MKPLLYISINRDGSIGAVWDCGGSWDTARFFNMTRREVIGTLRHRYGVRCTKAVLDSPIVL